MTAQTNISGFGVSLVLIASVTYPSGLPISQFAADTDPITINDIKIADTAMGLNGDLMTWQRAMPLPMTINVIPGGVDDVNLQILADANRVAQGKNASKDVISATLTYPDGSIVILSNGVITDAAFGRGVQSTGKQRDKTYSFLFAQKV